MNGLQYALKHACDQLGLDVEFDKVFEFGEQSYIKACAHILNVGAPMGMLVFQDATVVWPLRAAIRSAGYGYSVLQNRPLDSAVDIDSFKKIFSDWGWSGDISRNHLGVYKVLWTAPGLPEDEFWDYGGFGDYGDAIPNPYLFDDNGLSRPPRTKLQLIWRPRNPRRSQPSWRAQRSHPALAQDAALPARTPKLLPAQFNRQRNFAEGLRGRHTKSLFVRRQRTIAAAPNKITIDMASP